MDLLLGYLRVATATPEQFRTFENSSCEIYDTTGLTNDFKWFLKAIMRRSGKMAMSDMPNKSFVVFEKFLYIVFNEISNFQVDTRSIQFRARNKLWSITYVSNSKSESVVG